MPPRPPRRFLDRLGGRPATGGRTRHQDPRTRGGNRRHAPAACQEALTRQAHLKTDHARPKDNEHHSEAIETLKSDLDRALRAADPSERSTILGTVLPGLFRCHGVATRQVPAAPLTDAAVLIDFEEALFLVELRCSAKPLDFRQLAPHLVMLYGCPDQRGLLISSSGFTDQTLRELGSILPQRLFLCQLDELAQLLHEQGRSLREWLRTKFRAAETEQKPFCPSPRRVTTANNRLGPAAGNGNYLEELLKQALLHGRGFARSLRTESSHPSAHPIHP